MYERDDLGVASGRAVLYIYTNRVFILHRHLDPRVGESRGGYLLSLRVLSVDSIYIIGGHGALCVRAPCT